MKLKLDANGNAVLVDGKPVYVHEDGKEIPFDAAGTVATITRLNAEAKTHRVEKETALEQLKQFAGIEDPAAALQALKTVANIDQKKLVDAGQIEQVRSEITKGFQAQLDTLNGEKQGLEKQLYGAMVGNAFASAAILPKLNIPADLVQARFGSAFKVEDGKVVAYDANGNKLFSRQKPGEIADFNEGLELLIDQYPHKDAIFKGGGQSGSGAQSGNGGSGGKQVITRAAFEALSPMERAERVKGGTVISD